MAGAGASVELFAQAFDEHPSDLAVGRDFLDWRREEDIDIFRLEEPAVAISLARIFRQVFSRSKLGGVHENGNGNGVTPRLCGADQRQVAFMQSAHCWNEAEALATGAGIAAGASRIRGVCGYV